MLVEGIIGTISIVLIIIDGVMKDDLFRWNHSFTYSMQKGDGDTSLPKYMVFRIITLLGEKELIAFFVLVGFVFFSNKIQALKLLIATLIAAYILTLLKLFYHEPRPYFVYSDLQGIGCDLEYGKPSGHAMVTTILFYLLFDSIINRKFFDSTNPLANLSNLSGGQQPQQQQQPTQFQMIEIESLQKQQVILLFIYLFTNKMLFFYAFFFLFILFFVEKYNHFYKEGDQH